MTPRVRWLVAHTLLSWAAVAVLLWAEPRHGMAGTTAAVVLAVVLPAGLALAHRRAARHTGALRAQALQDPLTRLPNRAGLEDWARTAPTGPATVMVLDVDHLKAVNDGEGHGAGDALLRAVAAALAGSVRRGQVAARVGGDEFVFVAVGPEGPAAAAMVRRVHATADRAARVHGSGVSGGSACGRPDGAAGIGALTTAADRLLRSAKAAGPGSLLGPEPPDGA